MIRRLMFAALTLACMVTVSSTPPAQAGTEFGIKAGVTGATLTGDIADVTDPERTTGITGGLMLAIKLPGDLFAIQGEALYVKKGAKWTDLASSPSPPFSSDGEVNLEYIELPVLARMSLPLGLPLSPFIVAGPTFGYSISAKFKPEDTTLDEQDLKDQIKKLDTGFAVGAGARLGPATLEARYGSSLSDVQEDNGAALPTKNSVFTVMAGFVF
ncbi:MAG: outer membrane beta-barrel protein [Candidatus Eisenbacteria bacterium]|uniref:Outer membrane beta-barrel protein n=1 Tax=Eiseniibacteriota bacterium TaxID=2212470 RepID=A0A849SKD7_UNCEI|nr:outer membrane beta-barrel protein [Candidatus Eisenbacteria bacterium]